MSLKGRCPGGMWSDVYNPDAWSLAGREDKPITPVVTVSHGSRWLEMVFLGTMVYDQ